MWVRNYNNSLELPAKHNFVKKPYHGGHLLVYAWVTTTNSKIENLSLGKRCFAVLLEREYHFVMYSTQAMHCALAMQSVFGNDETSHMLRSNACTPGLLAKRNLSHTSI